MTLDAFAQKANLTKRFLARIERGESLPDISAALRIAAALDVDVARLFSDDSGTTAITVDRAADRAAERHVPLVSTMLGKAVTPFVGHPDTHFRPHSHSAHSGQEFIFVHEGVIELCYDGFLTELRAGDQVIFDSTAPHQVRRTSDEAATIVIVTDTMSSAR